jgi:hypothetical protein
MYKVFYFIAPALLGLSLTGCSQSNEIALPNGELTEAQKAAVKAEDAAVADEESQGHANKKK